MRESVAKNSTAKIYDFSPLTEYSWRERQLIRLADLALFSLVNLIGKTLRFEVEGWENFEQIEQDGRIPIYTFWHNKIFAGTYFFRARKIVVMSSRSFDAEYVGRFIKRFGFGTIRGSSTRGGIGALVEMIHFMREGLPMGFSIDGPKGPKYEVKPGAILLAKKTGNPIMPFTLQSERYWELKSWDTLQIPKPFSQTLVLIGKPIYVGKNSNDETLENKRLEVQHSLDLLTKEGESFYPKKK